MYTCIYVYMYICLYMYIYISLKYHLVALKLIVNHLQIIEVHLAVGIDAKFIPLLTKLTLFKTRIKVKRLTLEKGF